jgi:hypothetical protein
MPVAANPLTPVEVGPRLVSASVILNAYFGGKVVQFSWAALLIALGAMWYCLSHESFHPLGTLALLGPTQQVRGYVSELEVLEETDLGDGGVQEAFGVEGSHLIRQTIPRITYTYPGPDGRRYTAIARVGQDDGEFCETGTPVTVAYAVYNPAASRIEGLPIYWAATGSFVMIGFWVFLAGTLWLSYPIVHGLIRGSRAKRLLRSGRIADGTLRGTASRSLLKAYNVTDVTHDFEVDGQEFTSTRVRVDDLKEPLPVAEAVFFNPVDPREAVVLSDIPGGGSLDESGGIRDGMASGYNALCLPMLAAAAYLWFVLDLLDIIPPPSLSLFS